MKSGKRPRPLLLFYILVVYVFIQFGWWAFLLVRLDNEVNALEGELLRAHRMELPDTFQEEQQQALLQRKLHKQWLMIFGEGSVFLVLLVLGIYRTRSSFKKEAALAAQQKNFLLSVTHELRSPLASIRLQLETVQKRDLPREKQLEMHHSAIEDIDRLNALVENILVAARIDNSAYTVYPEKGHLSGFVTELVEKVQHGAGRNHRFMVEVEGNIVIPFDRNALHSILANLLENAVKYSPAGTEVHVSLQKKGRAVLLTVADRGPGIPDAEKARVFERFYRVGNEETRSTRGTGLGLYIVNYFVEAHGWSVRLTDRPGGGSVFEITIQENENQ